MIWKLAYFIHRKRLQNDSHKQTFNPGNSLIKFMAYGIMAVKQTIAYDI